MNDRAVRRIVRERFIERQRRAVFTAGRNTYGVGGAEQKGVGFRGLVIDLTQGRDVIKYPEAAPVRRDDQVVFVNRQIAHRAGRQIKLQRLPLVSLVK